MKMTIICALAIIAAVAFIPYKHLVVPGKNTTIVSTFKPVAIIELFTSQGCSSCPPADKLLSRTIGEAEKNGTNLIALSFHVDYWNRLGWTDPFSAGEYSERQRAYASQLSDNSVYTPQAIVNGSREFVGSDEAALKVALNYALQNAPAAAFKTLTANIEAAGTTKVKFALEGNYADCKLNFALVSLKEITSVKRGENGGHTLTSEHVVRQFISAVAMPTGEITFKDAPVPAGNNLAIVAYIQHNSDLKIIGAAKATLN